MQAPLLSVPECHVPIYLYGPRTQLVVAEGADLKRAQQPAEVLVPAVLVEVARAEQVRSLRRLLAVEAEPSEVDRRFQVVFDREFASKRPRRAL